jgi:hypothetical protein
VSPFAKHKIVDRILTPTTGSWHLVGLDDDGAETNVFWARVTAANGLLTVTGDFYPTTFAFGPTDPMACVRWMGSRDPSHRGVDSYAFEKARIGTGDGCCEYDVSLAKDQLRALRSEVYTDGDDDCREMIEALAAGIEVTTTRDGLAGVCQVIDAVQAVSYLVQEDLEGIGERPTSATTMAVQALNRLAELFDEEFEAMRAVTSGSLSRGQSPEVAATAIIEAAIDLGMANYEALRLCDSVFAAIMGRTASDIAAGGEAK